MAAPSIDTDTLKHDLIEHPRIRKPFRRKEIFWITVVVLAILGFLWFIGIFGGNVHTVVPGKVYRTAQLTGGNLDRVFEDDHIRTDINLRGGSVNNGFYRDELAQCRLYGVTHVDITLSARHLPPPDKLNQLLVTFDHAQYPLMYHCQAGADRTGLVTALYLNIYQRVPLQTALDEGLTWRHGHFSWGEAHPMDDFFKMYEQTGNGMDLRTWILKKYPMLYAASPEK